MTSRKPRPRYPRKSPAAVSAAEVATIGTKWRNVVIAVVISACILLVAATLVRSTMTQSQRSANGDVAGHTGRDKSIGSNESSRKSVQHAEMPLLPDAIVEAASRTNEPVHAGTLPPRALTDPLPARELNPARDVAGTGTTMVGRQPAQQGKLSFTEHPGWARLTGIAPADVTYWWSELPATSSAGEIRDRDAAMASVPMAENNSNIRPVDYAGAESCRECHRKNFEGWSQHPHRWMNANADEQTVLGDFSGGPDAVIHYRGGQANFYRVEGSYRMRLARDGIEREYEVTRTIGSRFHQYYIGRLIEGPEASNHPVRLVDHILFFGYWMERRAWIPVVHVESEGGDDRREDPFADVPRYSYDRHCATCHTTHAAGDRLVRGVGRERFSAYSPHAAEFAMLPYLQQTHPRILAAASSTGGSLESQAQYVLASFDSLPIAEHALALGITCEACHNGAAAHAKNPQQLPRFFPESPLLDTGGAITGRTSVNVNWACAQCHTGGRPMFATGSSTWNSTEYSDAMRGHCYEPAPAAARGMQHLTCIHCHDPHQPTGRRWAATAEQDDVKCLSCHDSLKDKTARQQHTHHSSGSDGDRCLNCHMPKINEGIVDMVRTHTIQSPNDPRMLQMNQPNACNLCHLDQSIDWTLQWLSQWYEEVGANPSQPWIDNRLIQENYRDRRQPVGLGWLNSQHAPTRLTAIWALCEHDARWALPELLGALDDTHMINRQFAQVAMEKMLQCSLGDFGYRYYMFVEERRAPLIRVREALLGKEEAAKLSSTPAAAVEATHE